MQMKFYRVSASISPDILNNYIHLPVYILSHSSGLLHTNGGKEHNKRYLLIVNNYTEHDVYLSLISEVSYTEETYDSFFSNELVDNIIVRIGMPAFRGKTI